nr:MAG TPA: hypothetical protein [Caudoviricetes sp.]
MTTFIAIDIYHYNKTFHSHFLYTNSRENHAINYRYL